MFLCSYGDQLQGLEETQALVCHHPAYSTQGTSCARNDTTLCSLHVHVHIHLYYVCVCVGYSQYTVFCLYANYIHLLVLHHCVFCTIFYGVLLVLFSHHRAYGTLFQSTLVSLMTYSTRSTPHYLVSTGHLHSSIVCMCIAH